MKRGTIYCEPMCMKLLQLLALYTGRGGGQQPDGAFEGSHSQPSGLLRGLGKGRGGGVVGGGPSDHVCEAAAGTFGSAH